MAKFCGNCGAPLNGGKFCPHCGAAQASIHYVPAGGGAAASRKTTKSGGWKVLVAAGLLVVVIAVFAVTKLSGSKHPCDWCNGTPTKAYKVSNGHSYVCKDCRETCMWCGDRPSKHHYENGLGLMFFVCDRCYEDFQDLYR